jgi:S1-C subfamily serine protease
MHTPARLSWAAAVLIAGSFSALSTQAAQLNQSADPPLTAGVFRGIAKTLKPSVVAIETRARPDKRDAESGEWLDRIFGPPARVRRQMGAGVVISRDGEILTNDHIVADAEVIEVRLFGDDRMTYRAHVVGRDPISDSALLRLEEGPLEFAPAALGDSSTLETGDWVMAIGNPFHLDHSISVGVVSHPKRAFEITEGRWQRLVQIDGTINPGNSGGPLVNLRGEVIGITVATMGDAAPGIAFALPINGIKAVLQQLRTGAVTHGNIGIRPRDGRISDDDAAALKLPRAAGVLILSVDAGSSGERGGLHAGDIILDFAGTRVDSADDLMTRVSDMKPGTRVPVVVVQNGRIGALSIHVGTSTVPTIARTPAPEEPDTLGLTFTETAGRVQGARVHSVESGSAAEEAGMDSGDVVRRINQKPVGSAADATHELRRLAPGRSAFVLLWRDGREMLVEIRRD